MIFFTKPRLLSLCIAMALLMDASTVINAQTNLCPTCWVPVTRNRFVTNVNVSNSIKGYVEFVPLGYNSNTTKHPLLIYIHGVGEVGDGQSATSLCWLACGSLPLRIEQQRFSDTVISNGTPYSFIVLAPQITSFGTVNTSDIQNLINYAIAHYRIDINRIYLTGISAGSNLIMDYMSSSATNANRIAAIAPLASCNYSNSAGASNIGTQRIHYWGIQCSVDNICGSGNTVNWANAINSYSPAGNPMAKYTLTGVLNSVFPHDVWFATYDSAYKENNLNMTQWMIQYSRNFAEGTLPVNLGSYDVSAVNKQVLVKWSTLQESNADYFIIERAGSDLQFKPIGQVKASGNSTTTKTYSFQDPQPLKGTSYYRLSLVNLDKQQDIYETKKIVNRSFGNSFALSPIPSSNNIQLNFDLEDAQRLQFIIRDINGRTLRNWSANFSSGYASFGININNLTHGIYTLEISGNNTTEVKKFIRN